MNRRDFVATAAVGTLATLTPALARPQGRGLSPLRVNGRRVNQHLADLSRYGRNPQGGVSRVAFSRADIEGRAFTMDLMRRAGLDVRIDPVGNILGGQPGTLAGAAPLIIGSHIDSVPEGGNYDGDVGSMAAIEVAHTLRDAGQRLRHPLWVAVWADEESGLTGSRGFVGALTADDLAQRGLDGVPLGEKLRRIGGDPDRLGSAAHAPGSTAAYVELHVEQGAVLDSAGIQIGIVEGIVSILQHDVTVTGFANHAGTTPMDRRRNALLTAAEIVEVVDRIVKSVPGRQVGTVGHLVVRPNAPNVVPGEVALTVELRDLDMATIEDLWARIRGAIAGLAQAYGTPVTTAPRLALVGARSDPGVRAVIGEAVSALGLSSTLMPSGAGHDAQYLARVGPMGMIFVPSVGGISHSPREHTRPEDVEHGANVLLHTVLGLDRR